jgi:hypothetical protein
MPSLLLQLLLPLQQQDDAAAFPLLLLLLLLQQHQACCDAAHNLCWCWPNRQYAARARTLRVAWSKQQEQQEPGRWQDVRRTRQ